MLEHFKDEINSHQRAIKELLHEHSLAYSVVKSRKEAEKPASAATAGYLDTKGAENALEGGSDEL